MSRIFSRLLLVWLSPKNNTTPNYMATTLRAESLSIFLDKSGRGKFPLPDLSRKIERDSARRVHGYN